jgi:hypothetical protein
MPFPIRTYDVMPLMLRSCAIEIGVISRERPFERSKQSVNKDLFFMAILNRLTGRPGVYCAFRDQAMTQSGDQPLIPRICECKEFLDFVDSPSRLVSLFNKQHLAAIPVDFRQHLSVFRATTRDISASSHLCLEQLKQLSLMRYKCLQNLSLFLLNVIEKNKLHVKERTRCGPKPEFLAHQILADLEEIYDEPFGGTTEDSIVIGHGGAQGLVICKKLTTRKENNRSCAKKKGDKSNEDKSNMVRELTHVLQMIVSVLKGDTPSCARLRTMLGCDADTDGRVVVALNRRALSLTDVEHFLCKLYVGASKTLLSRGASKSPETQKAGLHPVRFKNDQKPWDHENVKLILLDAIDEYESEIEKNRVPSPSPVFLFSDEKRNETEVDMY